MQREHSEVSVVVPAVNAASSVCCLRSLGRRGIHTIAVSEMDSPPAFWSRYADETVTIPSYTDDVVAYKDGLLSLAQRDDVRAIATFREIDAYVLAKYQDEFADHVEPTWPPMEMLRTAHDRVRLVEAAAEAGVGVPETKLLADVDDWDREWIVKTRYGVLTGDYVDSFSEREYDTASDVVYPDPGVEPDQKRLREEMRHDPIVQSYVPGEEYAVWALYDHGDPVATCLKRQVRAYKYEGGTSVCRETIEMPDLEAAGRTLLDHLDWHGPASVQFMRDAETGEFKLLEINPRFWVSLSCAVRAGLDFPYYFWAMATDQQVPTDEAPEIGVATHLLRGEMVHLHSVLRGANPHVDPPAFRTRAWEVAKSLYDQPNFDYLVLDDPAPFVRDMLNVVDSVAFSGSMFAESSPEEESQATNTQDSTGSVPFL
jgi:predicted ATP-grasp superfamily ATP-dependent carboligase